VPSELWFGFVNTKGRIMPKSTLLIAIASVFTSVSAIAATTFSDSAMNVDDYFLTTFAPSQTVSAFTTLAGGNPGSALHVDFQGTGKSFLWLFVDFSGIEHSQA
jgi:hypothetical protein